MCSHGSKVTLYKLYVSKEGQPLRLHMDGWVAALMLQGVLHSEHLYESFFIIPLVPLPSWCAPFAIA